jgi:4-hydroxy-tetrahydrodipicolinate reductase
VKIAIVGYGKMGRMIESLAAGRGIEIALKLDEFNNTNYEGITPANFRGIDVAIDFSIPAAVVGNIERVAALGVNMVIGTTGWPDQIRRVREIVERSGVGLVWSPNYSVGVNAFFRIVNEAARLLASEPEYEAWAWKFTIRRKKTRPRVLF